MSWMKYQQRQENIIYLVMWAMLFLAPILSTYARMVGDSSITFQWSIIGAIWVKFAVFLVLFLVHNFLLAPLLVYEHRRWTYFTITFAIIAVFTAYQCTTRPQLDKPKQHLEVRQHPNDGVHQHPEGLTPPDGDFADGDHTPPEPRPLPDGEAPFHKGKLDGPPVFIGEHDVVAVVILILMFGMNIGIKGLFKGGTDRRKLAELERQNLEQQLEYLKYQLNPHFLMNTLNNIHALIDIEPPKAQEAVIQLSKILRYVLYESNHDRVLMSKEVEFMENYVRLMRMRYGDKLAFTVNSPDDGSGVLVPPMLFISFVENAFKHGVSYQRASFIHISGKRYTDAKGGERLLWTCRNSKHPKPDTTAVPRQGGVGMKNIRQRLDLIFGNTYTPGINETDDTFEVILDIPLEHESLKKT